MTIANLIKMPNYRQDWYTFIQHLTTWFVVAGNAYVYLVGGGDDDNTTELYVLPNNYVTPQWSSSTRIGGYHINNFDGEEGTRYEPINPITGQSRVLHLRNLSTREDGGLGLSSLEPLRRDILAMGHALGWSEKTMRNKGSISGLFMTEGQLNTEEYERVQERLKRFSNNGSNTGGFMVVDGSQGKFQPMQHTQQEVDFLNTVRAQSNRIAGGIGVPSALLNLGTSTSASNQGNAHVDGVRDMFYNDTILPLANRIDRSFNMFFRKNKVFEGISIHLDTVPLKTASSKSYSQAQALVHYLQGGVLTPNEVREKMGEPRIDDPVADELMLGVPVAPAASVTGGDE